MATAKEIPKLNEFKKYLEEPMDKIPSLTTNVLGLICAYKIYKFLTSKKYKQFKSNLKDISIGYMGGDYMNGYELTIIFTYIDEQMEEIRIGIFSDYLHTLKDILFKLLNLDEKELNKISRDEILLNFCEISISEDVKYYSDVGEIYVELYKRVFKSLMKGLNYEEKLNAGYF